MECKKVRFNNEKAASDYIDKLTKTSTRKVIPLRSYLCPYCHTWHLTSSKDYVTLLKEEYDKKIKDITLSFEKKLADKGADVLRMQEKIKTLKAELTKKDEIIKAKNIKISEMNIEKKRPVKKPESKSISDAQIIQHTFNRNTSHGKDFHRFKVR